MFTGRELDSETGLYYYRARYYSAELGRFLQRDPVPSINLYAYVDNNPANYIDPFGLEAEDDGFFSTIGWGIQQGAGALWGMAVEGYEMGAGLVNTVAIAGERIINITAWEYQIPLMTFTNSQPWIPFEGAERDAANIREGIIRLHEIGTAAFGSALYTYTGADRYREAYQKMHLLRDDWLEEFENLSDWEKAVFIGRTALFGGSFFVPFAKEGRLGKLSKIFKCKGTKGYINAPFIPPEGENVTIGLIRQNTIAVQKSIPSTDFAQLKGGHPNLAKGLGSTEDFLGYTLYQNSMGEWQLNESGSFRWGTTKPDAIRELIQQQYGITIRPENVARQ